MKRRDLLHVLGAAAALPALAPQLFYPAIMTALADLRYDGYVGQEFIPSRGRDPVESLRHGMRVCTV